jgi:methylglutaconyl-CoA hydratase
MTDDAAAGELVHLKVVGGVATVTLDSPSNRNALSAQLVGQLDQALQASFADPRVRAVHLTATGTVFCAGADLKAGGGPITTAFPSILAAVLASPKPVVAELNGHARAGGVGLVAACDMAVAPLSATFAFTEVRLGLLPAMIAVPVSRKMARRPMERYFLTGETFGGAEAAASGLVTLAVADAEVSAVTRAILDGLRLGGPEALAGIKPMLAEIGARGVDDGFAWARDASARRFASEEAAEGMASFRERRPPRWAPSPSGG